MSLVDPLDLVDPERFASRGYPHHVWTRLRAEAPVARIEAPGFEPFWAVTRHADILSVSAQPLRYSSASGITLARAGAAPMPPTEILVLLDPPKHGPMRRLVIPWFTQRCGPGAPSSTASRSTSSTARSRRARRPGSSTRSTGSRRRSRSR